MDDKTKKNNLLKTTISIITIIAFVFAVFIGIAIQFPDALPEFPRTIHIVIYLPTIVLLLGIIAFLLADKGSS